MRSHLGWRGEQSILCKGVETSLQQTHFKNFEGKLGREDPKKTIFASSGLGLGRLHFQTTLTVVFQVYAHQ